ncbi:hypothetical protein ACQCLI_18790 [Pseudomonas nitroreducens]|uniref:hypothetical protein n=1 Tax=Pseudomonas TaxID=286 RepID=UPI00037721EE|nr:hypothetical protein [Pseudomonas nitroreducens]
MIRIFEDDDSTEAILEQGIAGVTGGRISTRNKLAQVHALAQRTHHPEVNTLPTVHHFWVELAFIYDGAEYRYCEAKNAVVASYDKLLEEQEISTGT